MRNEPNFQKSQMLVTLLNKTNYNEKMKLDTWSKQTQTNPNLLLISADSAVSAVRLTVVFSDDQAGVVSTEAEGVAQGEIDLCLAGLQRHIIHLEVASLILII